jgi:hypothetical protein
MPVLRHLENTLMPPTFQFGHRRAARKTALDNAHLIDNPHRLDTEGAWATYAADVSPPP